MFHPEVKETLIRAKAGPIEDSLNLYLVAQNQVDNVHQIDVFTDEYTEILAKISQTEVQLGYNEDAIDMFQTVSKLYTEQLEQQPVGPQTRNIYIKRGLLFTLSLSPFLINDIETAEEILVPWIVLGQREAVTRCPRLEEMLLRGVLPVAEDTLEDVSEPFNITTEFEQSWDGYKQELFNLREVYSGLLIKQGSYHEASILKRQSLELMVLSGFPEHDVLLIMCTIAALCFRQAYTPVLDEELVDAYLEQGEVNHLQRGHNIFCHVLHLHSSLPQEKKDNVFARTAYALAIYGKGQMELYQSKYSEAFDSLQDAIVASYGLILEPTFTSFHPELQKLQLLVNSSAAIDDLPDEAVPIFPPMFWRSNPEEWVIPIPTPIIDSL